MNTFDENVKELIITDNEFSAMFLNEITNICAISLPSHNYIPTNSLKWFENVNKIYLWIESENQAINNSANLSIKFGLKRTYIVRFYDKNLLFNLEKDKIIEYLNKSKSILQEKIVSYEELKDKVKFR